MKNKIKAVTATSPQPSPQAERGSKPDELKLIPWAEIFPDPEQPRKTFDEESLKELAESIRVQGLVQPLIVRLAKATKRIIEPELIDSEFRVEEFTDGFWYRCHGAKTREECFEFVDEKFGHSELKDRYIIIAGERRWRAAELAGLDVLPCIVREVSAAQKFAQQIIENDQREGISAIEEAEALNAEFGRRIEARAHSRQSSSGKRSTGSSSSSSVVAADVEVLADLGSSSRCSAVRLRSGGG